MFKVTYTNIAFGGSAGYGESKPFATRAEAEAKLARYKRVAPHFANLKIVEI